MVVISIWDTNPKKKNKKQKDIQSILFSFFNWIEFEFKIKHNCSIVNKGDFEAHFTALTVQ